MSDVARMASLVVNTVKAALDPVSQRLSALEQRPPPTGSPGPPGENGMDGKDGESIIGPKGEQGEKGERGKDADTADIEILKSEIVTLRAELGTQKDLAACLATDLQTLAGDVRLKMAALNDASANTLTFVKDALASQPLPEKGADGASVTVKDVQPLVAELVQKAVGALPAPVNGKDGQDGQSVDMAHVDALVVASVEKAVSVIPVPKDGRDGVDGTNGLDGKSFTLEDVQPVVADLVQKSVAAIPIPKDGVGVMGAVLDRAGHLVLTLTDGSMKDLGEVIGKDGSSVDMAEVRNSIKAELDTWPKPKDGKDGADGVGFDDLDAEYDEFGRMSIKFVRGEIIKRFPVYNVVYQGVWKDGTAYRKSDSVTWGGSQWTATADTSAKPGEPNAASRVWVLSVKRGSEGKIGPAGINGKDGKDGTWK